MMTETSQPPSDSSSHNPEDDLQRLVEGTSGLQPWRRLFHMTSGVVVALLLHHRLVPRSWALAILLVVLVLMVLIDLMRLRSSVVNRWFFQLFHRLASPREAEGVASSTWYAAGLLLTLALFPLEIAVPAILVLAVADPLASYLGRRWGKRPLGSGSIEGTLVFLTVSFLILTLFQETPVAAGVALFTSAIEQIPWRLDDNLTVPLAVGVGLMAAGALL
jgi:dolichol kinase